MEHDTLAPTHSGEIGLLNSSQAATYLNVSESYVRKAVARNSIPFVRIGTRVLFKRETLNEWIDRHTVATADVVSNEASHRAVTLYSRRRDSRRRV